MIAEFLRFDLTGTGLGLLALAVFCLAYLLVVLEERIHLRKSNPVVLAAGVMWLLTALAYHGHDGAAEAIASREMAPHHLEQRVLDHAGDYAALFLFLMVAMTYISAIAAHHVFLWLNGWLVSRGYGLRAVFWATGALAFCISPIADNLTTALLMGTVVLTVGKGNVRFLAPACVNIVVAANAGGAFSPFGDITTLMVWQAGKVETQEFLHLLLPSLVNWLIPAAVMHCFLPKGKPEPMTQAVHLRPGWWVVVGLFLLTIATAVCFHAFLRLPPFLGMTTGLGYLFVYSWMQRNLHRLGRRGEPFDVFKNVADVEWDTMLFFFGVIMCVGALQELMFLHVASEWLYDPVHGVGATWANIGVGVISAIIDNVPVMFAVLGMDPPMDPNHPVGVLHTEASVYQWLLVTLTAGVGGSLLSVGSAAGVALMGTARGIYTFGRHLVWLPAIALGYIASILVHYWISG